MMRAILLLLSAVVPAAGFGAIFFGPKGAIVLAVLAAGGLLSLAFLAERFHARTHGADLVPTGGLVRSLERSLESLRRPGEAVREAPRLLVFVDPTPNALVVRSLGGRGTILLSQGLLAILDEAALREILRECILRTREPGIVVRSVSAAVAGAILSVAPRDWFGLFFGSGDRRPGERTGGGAVSALAFAALLPSVRFYLRLSRPRAAVSVGQARRKLSETSDRLALGGFLKSPGAAYLYLVDPLARSALLPFHQ